MFQHVHLSLGELIASYIFIWANWKKTTKKKHLLFWMTHYANRLNRMKSREKKMIIDKLVKTRKVLKWKVSSSYTRHMNFIWSIIQIYRSDLCIIKCVKVKSSLCSFFNSNVVICKSNRHLFNSSNWLLFNSFQWMEFGVSSLTIENLQNQFLICSVNLT